MRVGGFILATLLLISSHCTAILFYGPNHRSGLARSVLPPTLPPGFTKMMHLVVAVGSYERILYGVDVQVTKDGKVDSVKESFAIPAHTGYLKSVSSCPRFLVSGATDETVRYKVIAC